MNYNTDILVQICEKMGITLSDKQIEQFMLYYELLIEKNKVMNLTAITEFNDVMIKHFADSISISKYIDMNSISSILDLGTGAGFPGIPLKILFPEKSFTLLDSLNKRILFLQEVIEKCGLSAIQAIHSRAEDFGKNKLYREQFDLCVSRAVANLSSLSEYCLPCVKKGGLFVSYKSGEIEEETKAAKKAIFVLGGELKEVSRFELPGTDISRSFVIIEKKSTTPAKYPRKAGLPSKEPISY